MVRKAVILAAIGCALVVLAVLPAPTTAALDEAKCQQALKLKSDPTVLAFKECAKKSPIPQDCCTKLSPFLPYAECLQEKKYVDMANSVLAPNVDVTRALKECVGA